MPSDVTDENVFLFVPNIIGYVRIVLATCSLYYMPLHPRRCSFLYAISCLLDALDGLAARHFKQSTRFGAVLDMVTDRCTTTCLLVFLAIAHPAYSVVFQSLISLDFASHYIHMYVTLALGEGGDSHKNVSADQSWLLNFYYKKWVLFTSCTMNELFFIGLYLLCFSYPKNIMGLPPSNPTKSAVHYSSAGAMELARANKLDDTVPRYLVYASAPVMAFKQFINLVQLHKASQRLAHADRQERKRDRVQASR